MKRRLIGSAIIAVLIIGSIAVYGITSTNTDNSPSVSSDLPVVSDDADEKPVASAGAYLNYDDETFAKSADSTRLLFFHASWCPQCRQLDTSIKGANIPDNVTVFKVDYDSNQALRQKYGVTIQTTIVKVDASGDKEKLYVAYEEPIFANVKKELLD